MSANPLDSEQVPRTVIDFEPSIRLALRHRAVDDAVSMSYLVNKFCADGLGMAIKVKKRKPGPRPSVKGKSKP